MRTYRTLAQVEVSVKAAISSIESPDLEATLDQALGDLRHEVETNPDVQAKGVHGLIAMIKDPKARETLARHSRLR